MDDTSLHETLANAPAPTPHVVPELSELPPPETKRWVIRRKAAVVAAVRRGILTLDEACNRYRLSKEELASWQRLIDQHGLQGLRTTRLQDYRAQAEAK
jgi:hypothetical protein